jgi:hypothetical protein
MRPAARADCKIWFQKARNIQEYLWIYHVYTMYHVYTSNDIPCISMDIPCIFHVYVGHLHIYGIYHVYAWYHDISKILVPDDSLHSHGGPGVLAAGSASESCEAPSLPPVTRSWEQQIKSRLANSITIHTTRLLSSLGCDDAAAGSAPSLWPDRPALWPGDRPARGPLRSD